MSAGELMQTKLRLQLHPHGITLLLSDANKSNGIKQIAGFGKVSAEQLVFVGDALTDMQGLELVRFPACPSNAHPKVKQLVESKKGYIAKRSRLAGCLDILDEFVPDVNHILKNEEQQGLYCVVFDFDGCLFEKTITFVEKDQPQLLAQFRRHVQECKGPFTDKPVLTINTGASIGTFKDYVENWNFPLYKAYGFNPTDVPKKFPNVWPPMMFEDGIFSLNPITKGVKEHWTDEQKEAVAKVKLLGDTAYKKLVKSIIAQESELKINELRIPQKDASYSIDFIGNKEKKLSKFHAIIKPIFVQTACELNINLEILE
ncbi:HAD hydrolase family protein [Candidatus Woesearchaeota archaeon]|nr:HAD hydrolase family protein [Candidatus Woesearchaeota archaeon]